MLATLLVILGALGWAMRDLVGKDMQSPSVFLTLAASSAIGLILNTGVMLAQQCAGFGCVEPLPARKQMWLYARCVGAASSITLNFFALNKLDLALSAMIHCTSPLFVVLLGRVFLGEHIRPLARLCIACAAAGMVVFIQPWHLRGDSGASTVGLIAAFGSSVGAAFSYTSLRALGDLGSTTVLFAMYSTSLILGAGVCVVQGVPRPNGALLWHFGALGVVTFLAEVLITKGYAFATRGAGSVAAYKFLTPVFSMVFDAAVLHQRPDALNIVGAVIVLAASAALVRIQSSGGQVRTVKQATDDKPADASTANLDVEVPADADACAAP